MSAAVVPLVLGVAAAWAAAGTSVRLADGRAARRRLVAGALVRSECADRHAVRTNAPRTGQRTRIAALLLVGAATVLLLGPVLGAGLVAAAAAPPLLARRRRPALAAAAAVASLPDTVDLIAVAARAGLPAPLAVAGIASRAPPPWGPALVAAVERTRRGERFGDALAELVAVAGGADIGHPLRALLRSATEEGTDLVAGLDRLAADARDLRRRRAEEAARRIPVRLLLPLVACSLPAFALLTIVPIVAGALRALDLSTT